MTPKLDKRLTIITLAMTLFCMGLSVPPAASAQQVGEIIWETPVNLSNSPSSSTKPAIVADPWGQVHVFWSEDEGGPAPQEDESVQPGDTIYYTRGDGTIWSQPTDIFFLEQERFADPAAVVDSEGTIHLIWVGSRGVYYSSSPALAPFSARSWKPAQLIVSTDSVDQAEVVIGSLDQIYVIYNRLEGEGGSLFFVKSEDLGATWDSSQLPFDVHLEGANFAHRPKIAIDAAGRLHLTWLEFTGPPEFQGLALQYARSEDGGETWSTPYNLSEGLIRPEEQVSESALLAIDQDTLLVVYIQGEFTFRRYRYSTDGGLTWSEPRAIFGQLRSRAGWDAIAVDGAGTAHLVAQLRVPYAIYSSSWDGRVWEDPPRAILTEAPLNEAHYPQMVASEGNQLHVVLADIENGEIWYMRGTTQAPETPALAIPSSAMPTAQPTPAQPEAIVTAEALEEPTRPVLGDTVLEPSTEDLSSPADPILIGAIVATLLSGSMILFRYARLSRR